MEFFQLFIELNERNFKRKKKEQNIWKKKKKT